MCAPYPPVTPLTPITPAQGMMFLTDLGFPLIDHVQSGNVFVVDDICLLGGYENTLLGYKTRIYRLCKDHLSHFDVILFGKLLHVCFLLYEVYSWCTGISRAPLRLICPQ